MRVLRTWLTAAAMLALGSAAAGQTAPADEWPQFRGTAGLSGVSASAVADDPQLLWTLEAGESVDSSAAIVDGVVYVGTYSGTLVAADLETGDKLWSYEASTEMGIGESSPAVSGGLVYIGDLAGFLHAVDAASGEAVWTFQTDGEIKSSPVVDGDVVLIGSYDAHLYGLGARTGELIWKYETLNYFGGCDEMFRGIRASDGEEVFSVPAGAYTAASATTTGNRAFFGTFNNEVIGVDLSSKEQLWRYEHPQRHFPFYSSALNVDGTIVIGGRDRMVHGIDQETGAGRWTFRTRARIDSSPAAAGGRVFIGSGDGRLYMLDLETGEQLWDFDTGAPLTASPAIADGKVVIASQDGILYVFG